MKTPYHLYILWTRTMLFHKKKKIKAEKETVGL